MDFQVEGGFKTVMSWKGEVELPMGCPGKGVISISSLREIWIFSVSYILLCMVNRYFNIFTILLAALQNFDYT